MGCCRCCCCCCGRAVLTIRSRFGPQSLRVMRMARQDLDAVRLQLRSLVESHRRQQDELQQTAAQRAALSTELTQLRQVVSSIQQGSDVDQPRRDEQALAHDKELNAMMQRLSTKTAEHEQLKHEKGRCN